MRVKMMTCGGIESEFLTKLDLCVIFFVLHDIFIFYLFEYMSEIVPTQPEADSPKTQNWLEGILKVATLAGSLALAACGKPSHVLAPSDVRDTSSGVQNVSGCTIQMGAEGFRTPFGATIACPDGSQTTVEAMCVYDSNGRMARYTTSPIPDFSKARPCGEETHLKLDLMQ